MPLTWQDTELSPHKAGTRAYTFYSRREAEGLQNHFFCLHDVELTDAAFTVVKLTFTWFLILLVFKAVKKAVSDKDRGSWRGSCSGQVSLLSTAAVTNHAPASTHSNYFPLHCVYFSTLLYKPSTSVPRSFIQGVLRDKKSTLLYLVLTSISYFLQELLGLAVTDG